LQNVLNVYTIFALSSDNISTTGWSIRFRVAVWAGGT
jgi:hypothetical protein